MKERIIFQGRQYDGIEGMPGNIRREYEKYIEALRPGSRHKPEPPPRGALEEASRESGIRFLGSTYADVDSMPPDVRDFYEEVNRDSDGDGVQDSIQRIAPEDISDASSAFEDEPDGEAQDTLSHARQREKAYLSLSLLFIALSPLAVWGLFQAKPEALVRFDWLTLVVAVAGFVLAGLVDFLMGRGTGKPFWSRIWVRNPVARSENEVRRDRGILMQEIARRLRCAGLRLVSRDNATESGGAGRRERTQELAFEGYPVSGLRPADVSGTFVNYRATGSLRIEPTGRGYLLLGKIARPGIVLIDTGQTRRLRSVIRYLTLRSVEREGQEITFPIIYGLCLVFASVVAGVFALLNPSLWGSVSVRATLVGFLALVVGRMNHLFEARSAGNKLVYVGLLLAMILWLRPVSNMFF